MINNAGVFFDLAKNAHKRSEKDSREAIVGLVLSAVALEAVFNELIEAATQPHTSASLPQIAIDVGRELRKLEKKKMPIPEKFKKARHLTMGSEFQENDELLCGLELLFQLRNAIVHNKPEDWNRTVAPTPYHLIEQLSEFGVLPRQDPNNPPQLLWFLCDPRVARWSHNLAVSVVKELIQIFPPGDFRQGLHNEYDYTALP